MKDVGRSTDSRKLGNCQIGRERISEGWFLCFCSYLLEAACCQSAGAEPGSLTLLCRLQSNDSKRWGYQDDGGCRMKVEGRHENVVGVEVQT